MNLLVNGCSFSRGPGSWPYFVNCTNLTNLAQAGAGNSYIHESTVFELSQRSYDYVIVMWSGISRIDFKVEDERYFHDSSFTSKYQKQRNDWPGKVIYPVNDQDFVDDNWVFGDGIINNEKGLVSKNFLNGIYKYLGNDEFVYHFLQKIVALESFLKSQQIPYLFSFYKNYLDELRKSPLFNLLNKDRMIADVTLAEIAAIYNSYAEDGLHPGDLAHKAWADIVNKKING